MNGSAPLQQWVHAALAAGVGKIMLQAMARCFPQQKGPILSLLPKPPAGTGASVGPSPAAASSTAPVVIALQPATHSAAGPIAWHGRGRGSGAAATPLSAQGVRNSPWLLKLLELPVPANAFKLVHCMGAACAPSVNRAAGALPHCVCPPPASPLVPTRALSSRALRLQHYTGLSSNNRPAQPQMRLLQARWAVVAARAPCDDACRQR